MLGMSTLHRIASYTLVLLLVALAAPAEDVRPSAERGPSQIGFLFVNYYGRDLTDLERRAAWVSEFDLAVALHLVRHCDVELDQIVTWRREGSSWDAITRRCGLGCEIYYVELDTDGDLPDPYARPYATWIDKPGADLRLSDVEVRELVLLRAMSEYTKGTAEEIVRLRAAGQTPKAIAAEFPPRHRSHSMSEARERTAPPDGSTPTPAPKQ